jgi:hypothetical protein
MVIRKHNFSGIPWYDSNKSDLINKIEWCFKHSVGPMKLPKINEKTILRQDDLIGIVSPHAGYSCSGPHASHGFLEISNYTDIDCVIILGTNHTGMGAPTSLFPLGEWETPLGKLVIDSEIHKIIANKIENSNINIGFEIEPHAHIDEHSIDNQLPFLQYCIKNPFTIVPIVMGDHSLIVCLSLAKIIADIISTCEKKIIIVASSDFTHYQSIKEAEKRDNPVLEALFNYEFDTAIKIKENLNASICGFGPVLTLFAVCNSLKCNNNKLLIYGNSGETCGDKNRVVSYSSIVFKK